MKRCLTIIPLVVALVRCLAMATPARADEKLAGVACRSVHLQWRAPPGTAFYNEVVVDQSAPGTYFCVCGFNHGYFGIQQLDERRKVVIFSVWDPGNQNDPNQVEEASRVKLLDHDPAVRVKRFGNEGTGGQAFLDLDWRAGQTYRLLVTSERQGERTAFIGWIYEIDAKAWRRLVTFSTLAKDEQLGGYYSFVEDFRRNRISATQARAARFGKGWVLSIEKNTEKDPDKNWLPITEAKFTADSNPAKNIDAGVKGELFFLATGGETAAGDVKLNQRLELSLADRSPPQDLVSLLADLKEPKKQSRP